MSDNQKVKSENTPLGKSSHPDKIGVNALKISDLPLFSTQNGSASGQYLFSLHDAIAAFCKEKKIMLFKPTPYIDFTFPKLSEGTKEWLIYFYVKDPGSGRMKRIRIKINRIKNLRQRRAAAKQMIASLSEKLAMGWNPLLSDKAPKASTPLFDAFDAFEAVKKKEMEHQSFRSYQSFIRVFRGYLESIGFDKTRVAASVTRETAMAFLDYLEGRDDVSARTYNNYLSFLSTLWDWLRDKGYVTDNVFRDFKRKPKRLMNKKRRLLSQEEVTRLFSFLQGENPQFLCAVILCYCCFIRPKEIALLQGADLDLDGQRIFVRAEIAKNDNDSVRTIPDAALPFLERLRTVPPKHYLFGKNAGIGDDFSPGPIRGDQKKFSDYWKKVVRPACGFGNDIQFYSLKDTGITSMLESGIPINLVQQQADHSSVAMTAIYVGHRKGANEMVRGADIINQ